jgi:small subunit ribosomal protein S2
MSFKLTKKDLIEAGVQFGQTKKRWNPKMAKFIYSQKNNVYIINLEKVLECVKKAYEFISQKVKENELILFVGTKKHIQEIIKKEAERCNMPYVINRWLGGILTNFEVIRRSVDKLIEYEHQEETGFLDKLPKKEASKLKRKIQKLKNLVGGIKSLNKLPGCLYVVDPKKEKTAVYEARKLNIPIVAIVNTDSNPEEVDLCIPGNDESIKSVQLITKTLTDAVLDGASEVKTIGEGEKKEEIPYTQRITPTSTSFEEVEIPQKFYKKLEEIKEEEELGKEEIYLKEDEE